MAQINSYKPIAQAALNQYALVQGKLNFLGHSGNVTFSVEAPEGKFLLRIHQLISGIQDNIWQKPNIIESELRWLAALCRETDIKVQEPLQNQYGKWLTQVLGDNTTDVFYCSLLRWIDGVVSNAERTPHQAYQLGLLIAKLHQHSRQWKLPQNFERPVYDESHFRVALSKLAPAITSGLISAKSYRLLTAAVEKSEGIMKKLSRSPDIWGLIHADLHDGNYLFYNEQIRPIDFARCGFGYYLYDVAE
ncbi:MAG: phosphotransferase [Xenococcaceae cyanobacterium MO_188.B29]|nr:phosphotransferase [Xenococcaceae cyanobacterium MO_188.B29]